MRKLATVGALALLLVVSAALYFRIGWDRMTDECAFGDPLEDRRIDTLAPYDGEDGETGSRSVSYSWHLQGGFTCAYSNGFERSSYWF